MQHTPLEALPITGRPAERAWGPLVASVCAHAAVVLLVLLVIQKRPETPKAGDSAAPPTTTETVVLAPPANPKPLRELLQEPKPIVRAPVPKPERPIPRPQVTRGPENVPENPPTPTATPTPPAPAVPSPATRAATPGAPAPPPTEIASADAAFESETQRLFGRRNTVTPGGGMPQPIIRWNNGPTEDRDNDCTPRIRPPRPAGQPVTLEFVEGRVYNERTGVALSGAYLQMMGTPYNAFADNAGHYRLGFDPDLVDECRSQYVRVIARGVPPQLIVLGRGPGGTDIYLRP
jgi:hypothetical protein